MSSSSILCPNCIKEGAYISSQTEKGTGTKSAVENINLQPGVYHTCDLCETNFKFCSAEDDGDERGMLPD